MFEQFTEDYTAYMNLLQGGYNIIVGIVVLLGLGILTVLMFMYMPRTSELQAKNEKIRQLREQISVLAEKAAADAMSDRQERTEIVADRNEREQLIVDKYERQLTEARKERDLWRYRSRFAEKRAKVFAKIADSLYGANGDEAAISKNQEDLRKELQYLDDKIKEIDGEILEVIRAA